jgi:nucleoside-diphosphate-sugar epimerase
MKIGIIGSTGFIGSEVFNFLKTKTNYDVFKFSSYNRFKKKWSFHVLNEIKLKKPEIIVNCSGYTKITEKKEDIKNLVYSNFYSNIIFINQACNNQNFKSYINFGSKWELGDTIINKPLNLYAAIKKANESIFEYFSTKKISIISLKLFDTFGYNDYRDKLLNQLRKSYKKNKTLNITDGNQYLDYVNIEDVCSLILMIIKDVELKKLKGFKSFTVSSKKPLRLNDLIALLKKILNKKLLIKRLKKYRLKQSLKPTIAFNNYPGWKIKSKLEDDLVKLFDK